VIYFAYREYYMEQTMPWWRSRVIIGALVSALTKILVIAGVVGEFTDEDSEALVEVILLLAGGVGDLIAIHGRVTQKRVPKITAAVDKQTVVRGLLALALLIPAGQGLSACTTLSDRSARIAAYDLALTSAELAYSNAIAAGLIQPNGPQAIRVQILLGGARVALNAARDAYARGDLAAQEAAVRQANEALNQAKEEIAKPGDG